MRGVELIYRFCPTPLVARKCWEPSGVPKGVVPYDPRFQHQIELRRDRRVFDRWSEFTDKVVYPASLWCYNRFGIGNYDVRLSVFMFRSKADAMMFKLCYE